MSDDQTLRIAARAVQLYPMTHPKDAPLLLQHLADTLVGTAGRTNLDRARAALHAIEEAGFKIVRIVREEKK